MDHVLDPLEPETLEPDQQGKPTSSFALWIAASLLLHIVCSVVLLALPQGPTVGEQVTYVDLNSIEAPPALTAPPKAAPPEPVAQKEEMAVPEAPVDPEPLAQETAAPQEEPPAAPQPAVQEQLPHTTLGVGLTKGFFKTLSNGETLRDDVNEYYMAMLEKINEKWWLDPQLQRRLSTMVVHVTVARNGEIVDSTVLVSSGDRWFDRKVLTALAAASPLPPLPDHFRGENFQAPIRLVPPLNLLAW